MKLLVTGAWRCTKKQLSKIENMGHSVVFMQNETDALPCDYTEIEGVICNGLFLYHDIRKFTSLKYIQLTSVGLDRVPMDYIREKGIEIRNAHGVYSIPMAEFAVGGVLQLYKQSRFFYENQRKSEWKKHRGLIELHGKTVCIVGCGNVGTECAKRFQGFGCRIIGVDLFPQENNYYENVYPLSRLDCCLSKSDIAVLAVPLTNETRYMMNEKRFNAMKNDSVIVNISRGAVLEEQALLKALDGKLLGAVLDVFEEEPLPVDSPIWKKENLIVTPHNSFVGDGNEERLENVIASNLRIK